jgi:hypothetical protein
MDAVANLLLERQRYEQWIVSLEAKKAVTPQNVFERVRADYDRRLREVIAQIMSRTAEVQAMIASLTERLGLLQKNETVLREQRYEAELRAAVGEYTPDQWKEVVKVSDERIASVSSERARVTADLTRLHQVLSMAGAASVSGVPASGSPSPAGASIAANELDFLQSVVGKDKTVEHPAFKPASPTAGAAAGPPMDGIIGNAPPGVPNPVRQVGQTPVAAPPEKLTEEAQRASQESGAVPSYLKDVPKEQVKTLKCRACGTMNLPSEWYCESCGGELAAL